MGRLDEAQLRLQEMGASGWTITRIYAEVMSDLGRVEEARAALRKGRRAVERSGPGFRMFELLLEAFIDLRFDRDTAAAEKAVAEVEAEPTASQRRRIVEQLGLIKGWTLLIKNEDEAAAAELRQCVEAMVEWDRLLFLPTAAVFLAEAEWRLGNEDRADEAADIALSATERMGSDHPLLLAAQQYPAIIARRLDAEAGTDSPWHSIGRKLMNSGRTSERLALPRVKVHEFGDSFLSLDGVRADISLTKSIEVLAYLAINGGAASKQELLSQLFTSRSEESARSYLRQALDKLQKALPGDAALLVDQRTVRWQGPASLGSDSIQLREQLDQAQSQQGRDLIDAVMAALVIADGEYLPGLASSWVEERRRGIEAMINDAKHLAARAAFEIGDYGTAESLLHRVLEIDPYRESSWRLSMRIAAALGDDDQVIARYRLCSDALRGINVDPADSTQQLVESLRR
jgi:DNA-binding SARP family transcriptional activator